MVPKRTKWSNLIRNPKYLGLWWPIYPLYVMIKFKRIKPILHHTPQNAGSSRHCSGSSPFDTLQELHPTDQFSSQVNRLTCCPLYPNQSNSRVLWHCYSWLQFHNLVSSYQIEILSNFSAWIDSNLDSSYKTHLSKEVSDSAPTCLYSY